MELTTSNEKRKRFKRGDASIGAVFSGRCRIYDALCCAAGRRPDGEADAQPRQAH